MKTSAREWAWIGAAAMAASGAVLGHSLGYYRGWDSGYSAGTMSGIVYMAEGERARMPDDVRVERRLRDFAARYQWLFALPFGVLGGWALQRSSPPSQREERERGEHDRHR